MAAIIIIPFSSQIKTMFMHAMIVQLSAMARGISFCGIICIDAHFPSTYTEISKTIISLNHTKRALSGYVSATAL
jgi:hypothetical protein